jgi:hypothetical protein
MQVENPIDWAVNASVAPTTKAERPEATAPRVDSRSHGGSFEPIRNPYVVGFRGAPKKRKKSDK